MAVWITNWCFVNDKRPLKDFCDALLQNKIYLKMIEIRGDFLWISLLTECYLCPWMELPMNGFEVLFAYIGIYLSG